MEIYFKSRIYKIMHYTIWWDGDFYESKYCCHVKSLPEGLYYCISNRQYEGEVLEWNKNG